ncbi:MAG: CvpA family protein [Methylococcales bacterium]|nr:CvpA family protein [Methylococcales bacterium]
MIWIDYVIIGLAAIGLIVGLLRGFSVEAYSLFFWMLATVVGLAFSLEFSTFLEPHIKDTVPRIAASFGLLFWITLIIGSVIRFLLGEAIKKSDLTILDRLGGMLVGAIRGLYIMVVLILLAGLTPLPDDLWWGESTLLPPFELSAVWLRDHIPSGMSGHIHYHQQPV